VRVREAIRKTGYRPNQLARNLRTSQTKTVGILVPDITNEFFARIVVELQSRFFADGYLTLIYNTNEDAAMERLQLEAFQGQQVSGLIYVAGSPRVKPTLKIPVLYVDRRPAYDVEDVGNYTLVESDNRQGGRLAAEELIRKGCRNIACVHYNDIFSTHGGRIAGYCEVLEKHGLRENLLPVASVSFEESRRGVLSLFARHPETDGLFCTTDALAVGAIKAAGDLGLAVPGRVKIAGFDDTAVSTQSIPALTTVRQDVEGFSRFAAELMIARLAGKPVNKLRHQFPVELIVRGST
jgi:LacI family transcriptional regulator